MKDGPRSGEQRFARICIAGSLLGILVLTLTPAGHRPPYPFTFCIACGERGVADGILNALLFVPLGIALAWNAQSSARVILFGFLLSAVIEVLQSAIPGRDPSVSDVVFNAAGTALGTWIGHYHRLWLSDNSRTREILTGVSLVGVSFVLLLTVWLLKPVGPASISRVGRDLVLRFESRASTLGLDQPEYWSRDVNARSGAVPLARRDRSRWQLAFSGGTLHAIGPTIGRGWAVLAYPDAIGRRWQHELDGLWIFLVWVPVGFFTRGQRRLFAVTNAVAATLLIVIPTATGIAATTGQEWLGAELGIFLGAAVGFAVRHAARDTLLGEANAAPPNRPVQGD